MDLCVKKAFEKYNVDENDFISFGGKSLIKPIVSFKSISFHNPVIGSVIK